MSAISHGLFRGVFLLLFLSSSAWGQTVDSDHDGLSDVLEQRLLDQFQPVFHVGKDDCAGLPATFQPDVANPTAVRENGTIYGQVFSLHASGTAHPTVEVHFYHLWNRDCGAHGHPLDAEHVAVLLRASGDDLQTATWKAVYWYAAAHENTVCDVSQITRAVTLHAEDSGANIWISPDKHASYLDVALCSHGCGADRCETMVNLPKGKVVNLGEAHHPMNGSTFIAAPQWPLVAKMELSNFSQAALDRAGQLGANQIALYNPGRHPLQGVIAISSSTEEAIAHSGEDTTDAVGMAGDKTTGALANAGDQTGNALNRSYQNTRNALGTSVRHVGRALGLSKKAEDSQPSPR